MAEAAQGKLCGDGPFTAKATSLFIEKQGIRNALLTSSGTHALELAALLCDLEPGDEVILPSFIPSPFSCVPWVWRPFPPCVPGKLPSS